VGSRTPFHGGIIVATVWALLQLALWTVALLATMFLTLLLLALVGSALNPTNWIGTP
jgi:hypothetical protein